jgi:RHS repeat-associated protein
LWSVTSTDANGKSITRERTVRGLVERTTIGGEEVATTSRLDPLGRLVALEDALGNRWTWTYDSRGRVIDQVDPDAGRTRFTYDEATGVDTQTDAKGQVTSLAHDPAGRVLVRQNAAGTTAYAYGTAAACPETCNVGRLIGVTFPGASSTMDYDALGSIVRQARTVDGAEYVVRREYDAAGRLSAIVYPDGDRIGPMGYDEAGRLTTIPGILEGVTYDAAGRPLEQRNANGTVTARSYWPGNGLSRTLSTTGPGGVVQQIEYAQYDKAGLLRRVTSPVDSESWEYGYDDAYRLTTATNLTRPAESQSFVYDKIGRITESSRYGAYAYPSAGEPRPHGPTSVGGTALTYDTNGNTIAAGSRSLVWNADNLPAQVTLGAVTTTFAYDGFGERVKKGSSGVESLYPFGDDYEITGGVVTKYVSVDGLGVIAKRVTGGPEPGTYWLHTDRLGSIQAVTDGLGSTVFRRTYRPYGETLAEGGSHTESRGWIDQRNDRETGLTYLHARYFDPQLGLFLSPDPLAPTRPGVGLNRYAYGFGNPVNVTDRAGLDGLWGDCNDGSGDTCWYDLPGLGVVVEVTAGAAAAGGYLLDQVTGRFGIPQLLALFAPQVETPPDDTGQGNSSAPPPQKPAPPAPTPPSPTGTPKRSKTVVVGGELTVVAFGGFQCGLGGYYTPQTGDFGMTSTVGLGGGWDVAAEVYGGAQNTDSLEGDSLNVNVSPMAAVGGGGSLSLDPETQAVTGWTVDVGVSPLPFPNGASITRTQTRARSFPKAARDLHQTLSIVGKMLPPPCGW